MPLTSVVFFSRPLFPPRPPSFVSRLVFALAPPALSTQIVSVTTRPYPPPLKLFACCNAVQRQSRARGFSTRHSLRYDVRETQRRERSSSVRRSSLLVNFALFFFSYAPCYIPRPLRGTGSTAPTRGSVSPATQCRRGSSSIVDSRGCSHDECGCGDVHACPTRARRRSGRILVDACATGVRSAATRSAGAWLGMPPRSARTATPSHSPLCDCTWRHSAGCVRVLAPCPVPS
jgi:hypothetical protein